MADPRLIADLVKQLQSEDNDERAQAAQELEGLDAQVIPIVPELIALSPMPPEVLPILRGLGSAARHAASALSQIVEDKRKHRLYRSEAARVLISVDSEAALRTARNLMTRPDLDSRELCIELVGYASTGRG